MPELVFVRRGDEVLRFSFATRRIILGRGEACDVVIPDPTVSRRHLALLFDGDQTALEDLSGRGTLVNGAMVRRAPLEDGADIALGPWRAVYRRYSAECSESPTQVTAGQTEPQTSSGCVRSEPPAELRVRQGGIETVHALVGDVVLEPVRPRRIEHSFHGIIGNDISILQLAELIDRVAPSTATVAIFGESGTGKELVARAIHGRSHRSHQPFVPVNCAAISKELIESELFGHEKGAFTGATNARRGAFEEADGGTLFLDEVGELPFDLQAKLLRALESGEIKRVGASRPSQVDVRVVAATNRNLLAACRENRFREDLYYRLCVVPLHLSPLRSRPGDIVGLAEHFLRTFSPKGQEVRFTPAALDRLQGHVWPGNVRELRNVVHRALLLRRGPMIDASDLTFDEEVHPELGVVVPDVPPGMTLDEMLEKLERQIIESSLRRYNQSRERVAKELGVARSTLFKRLKDWGLTRQGEID